MILSGSFLACASTASALPHTPRSGMYSYNLYTLALMKPTDCRGGILTGKLLSPNATIAPGSHFDPAWRLAPMYVARFGHANDALRALKATTERHGLQLVDVAYRWLQHHSALVPGDHGIIIGNSDVAQLEKALVERYVVPFTSRDREVLTVCGAYCSVRRVRCLRRWRTLARRHGSRSRASRLRTTGSNQPMSTTIRHV